MKRLALLLLFTCLQVAHAAPKAPAELEPVSKLDLQRYMGTWYEVGKIPNRFQKQCASDTTATYSLQENGRVKVVNRCVTTEGKADEAVGEARLVGEAGSARLQVRFAPRWLSPLPFVWGDYWVIEIDPEYQLAAVSEPKREYLWILSRTPQVSKEAYARMLLRLSVKGFDLRTIEASPQSQR